MHAQTVLYIYAHADYVLYTCTHRTVSCNMIFLPDDVTYVYDVYDDVTYVYDDVTVSCNTILYVHV